MLRIFILSLLLVVIISKSSYAYLDPGTGSMILQGLAAIIIGVSIFWRKILNVIRSLFVRKDREES